MGFNLDAAKSEILEWVSKTTNTPVDQIDLDADLAALGVDSLDAVHLVSTIELIIKQELPEDVIQRVRCLNEIFELMRERSAAA